MNPEVFSDVGVMLNHQYQVIGTSVLTLSPLFVFVTDQVLHSYLSGIEAGRTGKVKRLFIL